MEPPKDPMEMPDAIRLNLAGTYVLVIFRLQNMIILPKLGTLFSITTISCIARRMITSNNGLPYMGVSERYLEALSGPEIFCNMD
jgi:hypothetical protein